MDSLLITSTKGATAVKKNNVISSPVISYAKTAGRNATFFVRLLLGPSLIACNSPAGLAGNNGNTGKAGADSAQGNQRNQDDQGNAGATGKKGTDATVIIEKE
jgi:hypothetical protein